MRARGAPDIVGRARVTVDAIRQPPARHFEQTIGAADDVPDHRLVVSVAQSGRRASAVQDGDEEERSVAGVDPLVASRDRVTHRDRLPGASGSSVSRSASPPT